MMPQYATAKIPRPDKYYTYRNLKQIPTLTDAQRQDISQNFRSIMDDFLLPELTWKQQDGAAKEAFVRSVIAKMPFLAKYHEAWPAEMVVREYLYVRHRGRVAEDRKPQTIPRRPAGSENHRRAHMTRDRFEPEDVPARLNLPFGSKGKRSFAARSPSIEVVESRGHGGSTKRVCRGLTPSLFQQRQRLVSSYAPRSLASSSRTATETSLGEFLTAIHPCMGPLEPVLIEGGILDVDHLDGLTALPLREQEEFLREDLGLQPFQMRMLKRGLEERARQL